MSTTQIQISGNDRAVEVAIGAERATFSARGARLSPSPDAALLLGLPPAMRAGEDLAVAGSLSPRLRDRLPHLQRTLTCFGEFLGVPLAPVAVASAAREAAGPVAAGVGCFFSGGMDSFHAALRGRDELTHLIFVHGFDLALDAHDLRGQAVGAARAAADELGLALIEVETDVRAFLDPRLDWDHCYGAALAAVALMLAPDLGRVIVPASDYLHWVIPWGSHPALDPLYSTEEVEIVADGADVDRVEKARLIGTSDVAMRHLRVCWRNPDGAYNCGRCEKCVRTMVDLRAAGHGDRCATLPPLDLESVAARRDFYAAFRRSQIVAARERGDEDLLDALLRSGVEVGDDPVAMKAEIDRLRRALATVEGSRSYRLTAPVRSLAARVRRHRHPAI